VSVDLLAVLTIMLVLDGCVAQPTHAPVVRRSTKAPATPPSNGIVVLDARSDEQDKSRIKQELASNSRDSLAPADVGYYMDVLNGRLKQVATDNFTVARQGDRLVLDLSERTNFEPGSTQVTPVTRAALAPISKALVEYRMTLLSLRVRGDDSSAKVGSSRPAEQRALAVARYLTGSGVASKRIVIIGANPDRAPTADAESGDSARIELQIEPIVRKINSGH
jgi:outer membrane protein OmpA-like peptidoglycan-associated protein